MLQSLLHGDRWSLQQGSEPLLTHSAASPFATAIRREKTYSANRGTVKERVTEAERIPLTDVSETEGTVSLRGGSHCLNVTVTPCEGGAELALQGETGWAYEFRLPALPGEAVFGGGEQYRQTNLRGEHVVNFVSEHIKASTVIEKALLPRALYREKPHGRIGSEDVAGVYLPPETMIELWPRVLHFAPCRVRSEGFNCLVVFGAGHQRAAGAGGHRRGGGGRPALDAEQVAPLPPGFPPGGQRRLCGRHRPESDAGDLTRIPDRSLAIKPSPRGARRVKQTCRWHPDAREACDEPYLVICSQSGHEAYSKMSGGHLVARVGRDL